MLIVLNVLVPLRALLAQMQLEMQQRCVFAKKVINKMAVMRNVLVKEDNRKKFNLIYFIKNKIYLKLIN
jgi:hypothetical protein